MRKIILRLTIAVLTFCLGAGCAALWFVYSAPAILDIPPVSLLTEKARGPEEMLTISACDLVTAPPNLYRDRIVRLRAVLVTDKNRRATDLLATGCGQEAVWIDARESEYVDDSNGCRQPALDVAERTKAEIFESELQNMLGADIAGRPFVADVEVIGRVHPYETGEPRLFIHKLTQASLRRTPVPKRPRVRRGTC